MQRGTSALFWDWENVRLPRGYPVPRAAARLRSLCGGDDTDTIHRSIYYDARKKSERGIDRSALSTAGFTLIDCPTSNKKVPGHTTAR